MNKLFIQSIKQRKQEIKNMYLAGESVPAIARQYGVTPRDIYYHLGKLTSENKGFHAKNYSLKQIKRKVDGLERSRKEDHEKSNQKHNPKSTRETSITSLADFD